jgi:hypothetical protein
MFFIALVLKGKKLKEIRRNLILSTGMRKSGLGRLHQKDFDREVREGKAANLQRKPK